MELTAVEHNVRIECYRVIEQRMILSTYYAYSRDADWLSWVAVIWPGLQLQGT